MTLFAVLPRSLKRQYVSQAAGFATVMVAATVLLGFWAGLPLLASWGPGFPAMRPSGALVQAVVGFTLVHPGKDSHVAFAVGLAIIVLAALALVGILFNLDLAIVNRWLAPRAELPPASFQARSAGTVTAALLGGSLALSRFERYHFAATVLAAIAGSIAVFVLLGYLTGIDTLYGSVSVNSPPLPGAVGLLCVAVGITARIGTMPALRRRRPLRLLLVMLGCAIVAPLLLFGVYAATRIAEAQLRQVRENLTIEARALSANIDREIIGEIERLQTLAASPSLHQGDFAGFQRQAEASLVLRKSGNIMLIDRNMQQLVNTWVPFGASLEKADLPEPVERAFATGKPQITDLFIGPLTHKPVFAISVPVQIDGENRYVLVRSPGQLALAGLVATNELPAGWQAVISDSAHRIVARSERQDAFVGKELPPAQRHRKGPGGVFEFVDAGGESSLEAYTLSQLTGWETAVWAPKALLEGPVRAQWWTLGVVAATAFTLVIALASWLGGIIARSVAHAARAAVALGEGGAPAVNGTLVTEVNTLMEELRGAASKRQATEDLLRDSEATFRAMFDESSVGKIEIVPEHGRFLRANAAFCNFVGYSEEELRDLTVWDITHPEERERDREPVRRMISGESPGFNVEKRYIRKDGTPVWAHTTANLIRDKSGYPARNFAVIQDIDARKRAEQELGASKDRLQLALNAAQLGSWQYDPVHRTFSGDARAQEIFDFAKNEAGIEEVMKRVHSDDVQSFSAAIEASLDPVNPKRSATEFRIRRAHGEIRWVETLGLAYFNSERRVVSFGGTVQDITERKEREEKEHLLMREINHRAKNMLSVVDAIAHQTANRSPEDFVERFSERVQALSANQDLLVRNEWEGVGIADLVRAQLAHFADLIGSRIAIEGPTLRLKPAAAQAIGLALRELATNAGKYGALSTERGRVDIGWSIDSVTFAMSWIERDGPPVSAPKQRGFGTTVMEAMTERSVDGAVVIDYAPSGLTWHLTCPAVNALEGWGSSFELTTRDR